MHGQGLVFKASVAMGKLRITWYLKNGLKVKDSLKEKCISQQQFPFITYNEKYSTE